MDPFSLDIPVTSPVTWIGGTSLSKESKERRKSDGHFATTVTPSSEGTSRKLEPYPWNVPSKPTSEVQSSESQPSFNIKGFFHRFGGTSDTVKSSSPSTITKSSTGRTSRTVNTAVKDIKEPLFNKKGQDEDMADDDDINSLEGPESYTITPYPGPTLFREWCESQFRTFHHGALDFMEDMKILGEGDTYYWTNLKPREYILMFESKQYDNIRKQLADYALSENLLITKLIKIYLLDKNGHIQII